MRPSQTTSTDLWYNYVIGDTDRTRDITIEEKQINQQLKRETPSLFSGLFERTCMLQCTHCIYQKEGSSQKISRREHFEEALLNIVKQMPQTFDQLGEVPTFLHIGRILMPWHIDVLREIQKSRPDMRVGMIDNGSYVRFLDQIQQKQLTFDWLDISLDGNKESHNTQRDPLRRNAFDMAINGLQKAREIVKAPEDGGYISSLFTMTQLNFRDIAEVADILLTPQDKNELSLADLFVITTMTPTNVVNQKIEISPQYSEGNTKDFRIAWEQIQKATKKYGKEKVMFRIYRHQDIDKIARVVGEDVFLDAMTSENITITLHDITFEVDGIAVQYIPLSTWPKEEYFLDTDSVARVAHSIQYTLKELRSGISKEHLSTKKYSVEKVTTRTNYTSSYQKCVDTWWDVLGKKYLDEEVAVFDRIRSDAQKQSS